MLMLVEGGKATLKIKYCDASFKIGETVYAHIPIGY